MLYPPTMQNTEKSSAAWPRAIANDPRVKRLASVLRRDQRMLWTHGTLPVAHLKINPMLEKTLVHQHRMKLLERGLERIEEVLAGERKGLNALNKKMNKEPVQRISRLLVIVDGGSDRFNRGCETLLKEYSDRLLGIRLNLPDTTLIEKLYGPEALTKAVLISHKDAVTDFLWALIPEA